MAIKTSPTRARNLRPLAKNKMAESLCLLSSQSVSQLRPGEETVGKQMNQNGGFPLQMSSW